MSSRYEFRTSHVGLLTPLPVGVRTGAPAGCDGVVVPSHLHPARLGFASNLARDLDCPLLVICTQGTEREAYQVLSRRKRRAQFRVLALKHPAHLPKLSLTSMRHPAARPMKSRDAAVKRNIGLSIARMLGCQTLLLVDDDVRSLAATDVSAACVALLRDENGQVVSWRATDFPDNSVVCHAGRRAGVSQDVFVGAGAMAVRISSSTPFFPPVYNEDWLFLFEALARGSVMVAGDVRQISYNPFDPDHHRAHDEEFGDILGEGLFHILHEAGPLWVAEEPEYWESVVHERRNAIRLIRHQLRLRVDGSARQRRLTRQAVECLNIAGRQHRRGLPNALARFVRAWEDDRFTWSAWFARLPSVENINEALEVLGIAQDRLYRG
jgi:hypothetical protein